MDVDRRTVLGSVAIGTASASFPKSAFAAGEKPYRRIACEEGFLSPGVLAQNKISSTSALQLISADGPAAFLAGPLLDLGEGRIAAMDADGIDMQLLLLSSPGVQAFDAATAASLAGEANDYASAACARYPSRFAALAALAPQDPAGAVRELQRAATLPGIKGAIVNSHTNGEYLDATKYWLLFEALEAMDLPLYIHPREPAGSMNQIMAGPVVGGPAWAYAVETGTHVLRLIQAGVFDRFPKLRVVIGHMGEALPFWLPRIDNRYRFNLRGPSKLARLPGDYIRENVWITTSGMNYWPQLEMTLKVLGPDRLLYATDYPFEKQGEAVGFVEAMPLDAAQKKALFEDNATRVFKL
ncbi:MAG: amidohydrolase [Novosphingobium sp.]|nr:amidohydrolase [Novosphingobium sp.]